MTNWAITVIRGEQPPSCVIIINRCVKDTLSRHQPLHYYSNDYRRRKKLSWLNNNGRVWCGGKKVLSNIITFSVLMRLLSSLLFLIDEEENSFFFFLKKRRVSSLLVSEDISLKGLFVGWIEDRLGILVQSGVCVKLIEHFQLFGLSPRKKKTWRSVRNF